MHADDREKLIARDEKAFKSVKSISAFTAVNKLFITARRFCSHCDGEIFQPCLTGIYGNFALGKEVLAFILIRSPLFVDKT
jgi:hypothetical protein